jgi:hypothetical protein
LSKERFTDKKPTALVGSESLGVYVAAMAGTLKSTSKPLLTEPEFATLPKAKDGVVRPFPGVGTAVAEFSLTGTFSLPHVAATTYLLPAFRTGPSLRVNQQYEEIV